MMDGTRILLIQPPLLKNEIVVDRIQEAYWDALARSLAGILATEGITENLTCVDRNFTGFVEPNIGLLYVGGALLRAGCLVSYCDFHLADAAMRKQGRCPVAVADIAGILSQRDIANVQIAAISPLTVNVEWAVEIARELKRMNPAIVVIMGGVHASFEYEGLLEAGNAVDVVVVGEGEQTAVELALKLQASGYRVKGLNAVQGIAFRDGDHVVFTGKRPCIADLDSVAYPAYEIYPGEYLRSSMLRVLTSRGCTNRCAFCVPSSFFGGVRFRKPEKVVDEIEYHRDRWGVNLFMIGDLNFLNDAGFAREFCRELIDRRLGIHWMCQSRVDLVDADVAGLMREAGCAMVCLGVESANQNVLDASNKRTKVTRSVEACKTVKKAGLNLFTFWVFGLPGESHESAFETIQLLRKLVDEGVTDYTHCTMTVPYPGTAIRAKPQAFGYRILSEKFSDYWLGCDFLGAGLPVIETENLSCYEIYAYWQLALAVVAGNLGKALKPSDDNV